MADAADALAWIVRLLERRGVPFQAVGGLAARAYGATRPLADLDFYIPIERFPDLSPEVDPYIVRPPARHRDSCWDVTFARLEYAGQSIELGGAAAAFYFDAGAGRWVRQVIDFETSVWMDVLGVRVPVMPREELIAYKRRLDREVDRRDVAEIEEARR